MIICIPAHNEPRIGQLVTHLKRLYPDDRVLVVDDGSTDDTATRAEEAGAEVFPNPPGSQYGDGFWVGMQMAIDYLDDIDYRSDIVFIDAGYSYSPWDIAILSTYQAPIVNGYRVSGSWLTRPARWLLRRLTGNPLADYCSLRLFRQPGMYWLALVEQLDKRCHNFNPQLAYYLAKRKDVAWVPVAYTPTNTTLKPWGIVGSLLSFLLFLLRERLWPYPFSYPTKH